MYNLIKKIVYSIPPLLYCYRKVVIMLYQTAVFSCKSTNYLLNKVASAFLKVNLFMKRINNTCSIGYYICMILYKYRITKVISRNTRMRFMEKTLKAVAKDNLKRKLLDTKKEWIKSTLDPTKQTVAFCLTTHAYRGNLGNVIEKLEQKKLYNVLTLIGTIAGDKYEEKANVFYIPNDITDIWSSLDFIDVCITPCPFDSAQPPAKTVYFLHDIHDSPTANKENSYRVYANFDYLFLSSRYSVERAKLYIFNGKQKYLNSLDKEKSVCIIGGGYPKLDRNLEHFKKHEQTCRTIIFATTMLGGPDTSDLLPVPLFANKIISAVLQEFPDYELVFRPHPLSTNFKEVQDIAKNNANHPKFVYDDNASSYMENYAKSALMITDMSGTAYTYAFTTLRPVIFFSSNESEVRRRFGDYQYFIDRPKVGYVVENVEEMIDKIKLLLNSRDKFADKIREYRDSFVYNVGNSEEYFVNNFKYIIENKRHPDWEYV